MILRKRYRRDIKHNLSIYVSSTLVTVLSLLFFYLFHIAGTGILGYKDEFFTNQKVEDANFSTYIEIPQGEIEKYEEKYNLELEKQEYLNIETDSVTARVFGRTHKVNLYRVTKGEDVSKDDEIVISEGYAQNCNVSIGDKIKIKDKEYTVSGFMERPDYLYMLQDLSDSYKNVSSFFICSMTDKAFEELGEKNSFYLVRYNEDNQKEFRKDVSEDYIVSSYVSAKDNIRISMMESQPELFIQMAYVLLLTLPLIAVVLISVILSRKIKSEQKMIGTLAANGYTKSKIINHYIGFSAIPGVMGGIVTTILIAIFADSFGALGLADYEPLDIKFKLEVPQMILGIVIPTLMYILSTALTVNKLLKKDVTLLLSGNAGEKNKIKKFLVGRKASFKTKFSVRSIFGNLGRTFVLLLGVFLGSFVILFALGDYDSINSVGDNTVSNMGRYNYKYVLNTLEKENSYDGETLLSYIVEDESYKSIPLVGCDNNGLMDLKNEKGESFEVKDGYYITSLYATINSVSKGDKIKVYNPLSMESYEIKIDGIVEDNFSKTIYTTRKNVSKISHMDENLYNVILSEDHLNIPENKVNTIISKDTAKDQYEAMTNQLGAMITIFVFIGILLCIVSVYIAVNMTVSENRANISMLRVLGYDDRKISALLLDNNIFVVIPGILVGLPCGYLTVKYLFRSFTDLLGYLIEANIRPASYVASAILVLCSYFVSMLLVKRKIAKVDMVESLKDNRE